ncbi:metal-dependent phosphohydrolase [Methylobacterium sp. WL30]|uniref:metal-dependent phosphohydrolase n=1 Tax=unclassified Methylobacterium TaxID=2615210 RepID=UPI0011C7DFF4|nr:MULTISPECIES: metal-dependent phosphohydrolase [unclassified Methylobacterium]TXN40488.1 metal-dependent phosphohydrolase [Methylobacterium sp. WL93]TXN52303.1 metal-dependent phosphohydrolase [Methylobacterium sp. WL119]TXN69664.1 metal-dependent phosphohydrolase [Methylobacterium sp. WL30]
MRRDLILPPLRRTSADAEAFACAVHADQIDKAGDPYVDHLWRVAARTTAKASGLPGYLNDMMVSEMLQIAWLHDVIEDTPYRQQDLFREGFSTEVVFGVLALTKHTGVRYDEAIRDLCQDAPLAVLLVKLSDNEDNADLDRLAQLDAGTQARLLAKYEPSMAMLNEAVRAKGWRG